MNRGNPLFGDWGNSPRAQADEDYAPTFVETPVGVACWICEEPIQEGDTGELMMYLGPGGLATRVATHRECLILNTIGHMVGVCSCSEPPYLGLTKREAGIEAARRLDSGEYPLGA